MSAKVVRCDRCHRRLRNPQGWNGEFIAGLIVGYTCPNYQTPQEDLEAELNLITGRSAMQTLADIAHERDWTETLVDGLIGIYPTAEVMRDKATRLAAVRRDAQAAEMARLMRMLADDMEVTGV